MISFLIPVYNEENRLFHIKKLFRYLKRDRVNSYEIVIANDCSTDKTLERVRKLAENFKSIKVYSTPRRLGRGATFSYLLPKLRGDVVITLDVDMAIDLSAISLLLKSLNEGNEIAIGSRYASGALAKREAARALLSKMYNKIIHFLFNSKVLDHQCGFKAYKKKRLLKIAKKIKSKHWFWDTEFLLEAQREGLKIKEIPIKWVEMPGSKVTFNSVIEIIKDIAKYYVWVIRGRKTN